MDSNMHLRIRSGIRWFGLAAIAALVACDTDIDPQVRLDGTGEIEGFLFFDVSEDGLFDPSDGDVAIAGIGITLRERGTDVTLQGSSTQVSGPDGRFGFANIPAGTHDMAFDTLTIPPTVSICENPVQVTVFIGETRFAEVAGRPGCLITIAEAKELGTGGDFVVVRGLVTSFPGQIDASRTFIQDATAGALIFSASLEGLGIQVGDQLEIGANTGEFSGDFELLNAVFRDSVQGVDPNPQPDTVTTLELATSGATFTDSLQGRFIRLEKAQLMAQFGSGSLNIQNGLVDDGSGAVIVRIDDGVADRNNLVNLFTVGLCYNFQGFGANFAGAGQIFLRSMDAADMEKVACN